MLLVEDIIVRNEVSDRLRCNHVVDTVSAAPILRLPADESSNSSEVAFVAQEVCLLFALGPETDGV